VNGSDQIIESKRSRPLRFGRLFRDDDCEAGKIDESSSSSDFEAMLDSPLWRIRVRVSGRSLLELKCSALGSAGVATAMLFVDWRWSEFERDWRLLLVVEFDVDVEVLVEDFDSNDWSDFRELF
jgi:hypothetical protein